MLVKSESILTVEERLELTGEDEMPYKEVPVGGERSNRKHKESEEPMETNGQNAHSVMKS